MHTHCTIAAILVSLGLALAGSQTAAQTPAAWEAARQQMVDQAIVGSGIRDQRVVQAILATPRHEFVPRAQRPFAYYDMALPIGQQQTISSPYIVAYMTETLDPQPTDKVLEIGTGSGYQAAVLSGLVRDVYSIEIVAGLGQRAARTLKRLGYKNVHVRVGDGYAGWPEESPFDKIIVTCSPEKVPPALVEQLREGGRMIIPVGERYQQTLVLLRKVNGQLQSQSLHPTLFVPMTGRAESQRVAQPDLLNAQLVNGDFEQELSQADQVPGWYYQRQFRTEADDHAPQGKRYGSFDNQLAGRPALALQGFGIDGERIGRITISAWIKADDVQPGLESDMSPRIAVTFYDRNRRILDTEWVGPWRGNLAWQRVSQTMHVPADACEAIVRVGLFGATGRFSIDDVQMRTESR